MDRLTGTEGKDVVTVDDYGAIRRADRDGMSIRQIARQLGHSRRTVRHALVPADPHPEPLTRNRSAPKLGPFQALIEQILLDDETAPPKQRHTAAQIHRRLRRGRLRWRLRPGSTLRPQTPSAASRNLHSFRTSSRSTARSRFRTYPCRLPRWAQARPVPGDDLGLLQRSLRPGPAV